MEWGGGGVGVGLRRLMVIHPAHVIFLLYPLQEEKHLHNMVMHSSLVTVIRQGAGMACDSHVTVM